MTNFNFLSKSSSQSRSHRVVTLASTVGSPSAHRRGTMLKPLFLAMFFLLAGVGNVWGVDPDHSASETFPFTTSGCSGWTGSNCGSYCSAYGKSSGTPTISKAEIANFQAVDFDLHENVSLTIKVKGGNNGGTQTCTVTLIDKNGNKVSDYSQQQSEAYNGSTKNSAKTITFTFNPTQAFSGYKVSKPAKGWYVETSYTLTYDDKAPSVPYTVTLMDDNSELEESSAGAGVTLPSRTGCTGYTFAGWTTSWTEEQDEWTTTEPTIIEAGSYSPNADEYLYPVYTKTEGGGTTYQFQKVTALSQIKAGGTFIITNGSYYLPNGAATNAGPAVASMVTVTNGVVTGTVTDAMKWTFSAADANNRTTIKSVANSNNYLYTVSDGNGVRVSTTSDSWTFEEYTVSSILGFAMKSTSQNRYCAVYSTSNWRSYTTKNAANYSQNSGRLDIYKYTEVSSSTTSYISAPNCCSPLGSINGSFFLNQSFDPFYPSFLLILFSLCQRSFLQFISSALQ